MDYLVLDQIHASRGAQAVLEVAVRTQDPDQIAYAATLANPNLGLTLIRLPMMQYALHLKSR